MPPALPLPRVLILGGGPDAERQVSLTSSRCVAAALRASGRFDVTSLTIDRITADELRSQAADVIFPVLHGGWGEGGPLQEILEQDGRPFVSSGSRAARTSMDKIATKAVALRLGVPTPPVHVLDVRDSTCPLDFPVIVKPIHEGSTIGLYVVGSQAEWERALDAIRLEASRGVVRCYMIEPKVGGGGGSGGGKARELTVGLIDNQALPVIEIIPAEGLYDYEAKYHRDDTRYTLDPALPPGVDRAIKQQSVRLAAAIGVRHLARADFMLDASGTAWFLEINTIPGFTDHSLVPMAARHMGLEMPALCARLVELALGSR
jgi:D-alanine-D-alanine ligase